MGKVNFAEFSKNKVKDIVKSEPKPTNRSIKLIKKNSERKVKSNISKNDILKTLAQDINNPIEAYQLKAKRIQQRITGSKGSKHNNNYQFRLIEDVIEMMLENFNITRK